MVRCFINNQKCKDVSQRPWVLLGTSSHMSGMRQRDAYLCRRSVWNVIIVWETSSVGQRSSKEQRACVGIMIRLANTSLEQYKHKFATALWNFAREFRCWRQKKKCSELLDNSSNIKLKNGGRKMSLILLQRENNWQQSNLICEQTK